MEKANIDPNYNLIIECKKGSRKAQYELYKRYSKAMYNIALNIVNDEDEAADLLQESFYDAYTKISDFRQDTTFGAWLKKIVINNSINRLRKQKIDWVTIDNHLEEIADDDPVDEEEIQYQVEQIHTGIRMLPDGYRVVINLYLLEGYDHQEIAQILAISEATSRSQYMRAKRKLIALLKKGK